MAISSAQKLSLYNGALRFISEGRLASLTEARGPRRYLDDVWDGGAIGYCLEQGMWNFAARIVKLTYDPGIEPSFGFSRVFEKPDDFVRTIAVSNDQYFRSLFTAYDDKAGFIYADIDEVFLSYVSDDDAYGMDYALWPETFRRYVEAYLGTQVCKQVTGAEPSDKMLREFRYLLSSARSKDAIAQPSKRLPVGTWASARRSGGSSRETA